MDNSIGGFKTMAGDSSKTTGYTFAAGDTLGQYRILRPLGRGGMGEVYEVEHTTLERRYALKLLPADFAAQPGALDRFRREAKVMANLDHPNIVKVDEFGEVNGRYWLRMELAEGTGAGGQRSEVGGQRSEVGGQRSCASLEDLVKAFGGKVPQELVLSVVRQVLAGLQYAHGRGAVHRDLKPSNILFSGDTAKIADFGLVRLVGEEWVRSQVQLSVQRSMGEMRTQGAEAGSGEGTSTRSMLGTFEYMSPEQKRGENADARSDLYAVGVMAYRLLTGRNIGPKLPSRIDRELVEGWDDFVEQALEEEPSERLSDAAAGLGLLAEIEKQLIAAAKASQAVDEERAAEERDRAERTRKHREDAARRAEEERLAAAERKREKEQERQAEEAAKGPPPAPPKRKSGGGTKWVVGLLVLAGVIGYGVWQGSQGTGTASGTRPSAPSEQRDPTAGNAAGMSFVEVKAGSFQMGTTSGGQNDERPVRTVRISRDFWMGKTEVTQREYQQITGNNPSHFKGDDLPVETVSWNNAVSFCQELTKRERAAGRLPQGMVYRLPTEAEWEYAARGGENGLNTKYAGSDNIDAVAWYDGNSGQKTQRVGTKAANELGLHDMSGNVWEWVYDWYQGSYNGLGTTDPSGPRIGSDRVSRGGSWSTAASGCRVADRGIITPSDTGDFLGFRVVLAAPVQ